MTGKCTIKEISILRKPPGYIYSTQYATTQGVNNWYYQMSNMASYTDLQYSSTAEQWTGKGGMYIQGMLFNCRYPFITVLKHICQRSGVIEIGGSYKVLTENDNERITIRKNGTIVQDIKYSDTDKSYSPFKVNVACKDVITFELSNEDNKNSASLVEFDPSIQYLN